MTFQEWVYDKLDDLHSWYCNNIRWPLKLLFKYPYQRVTRGFDDRALWSLDHYLTEHIEKVLLHFYVEKKMGYPAHMTKEKWRQKLSELHRKWEKLKILKENEHTFFPVKEWKKEQKLYEKTKGEAFDALYELYEHLWD